jgi:hypothetical protein
MTGSIGQNRNKLNAAKPALEQVLQRELCTYRQQAITDASRCLQEARTSGMLAESTAAAGVQPSVTSLRQPHSRWRTGRDRDLLVTEELVA